MPRYTEQNKIEETRLVCLKQFYKSIFLNAVITTNYFAYH